MRTGNRDFLLWTVSLGIFALSLLLNLWNRNFPLGYHFDEPKKVRFILTGEQDFHHPVLMLELVRWANDWQASRSPQEVVELGRTVMGIVGACLPVVMIWVALPWLGRRGALMVGALVAVTPTLVLHSHYLKEDMLLVLLSVVSLGAFSRFFLTKHDGWLIVAGLTWGLAMGSHYKGLLVGVVALPFLLFASELRWRARYGWAVTVVVLALLGFLMPNTVIIEQWGTFVNGFNHERNHALVGHFVPIYWSDFYLAYHLQYSLLPGMTYGFGFAAVASLIWWTMRFRVLHRGEQLWLAFVWVSYLVPEVSPLKPNPDEARYMLPAIPGLIYFSVKSLQALWMLGPWHQIQTSAGLWQRRLWRSGLVLTIVLVAGIAFFDTILLNHYLVRDTRAELVRWAEAEGIQWAGEPMTGTDISAPYGYDANLADLQRQGYTHYAISSFAYDPYLVTAHLPDQPPHVMARRAAYEALLQQGTLIFEPTYRSFGFSNPRLVVIPLRQQSVP